MIKKIFLILLFATGIAYLYLENSTFKDTYKVNFPINTPSEKPIIITKSHEATPATQEIKPPLISTNKNILIANNSFQEQAEEFDDLFFSQFKHLNKMNFSSSDDITSAYLHEDGTVSRIALEETFNVSDFNDFIERIKMIEKSESAIIRENMLIEKLNNLKNININSENYSCAGKICTVSFYFEGIDEEVDQISTFAKNYVFKNIVTDENGNKNFKAVYIETDDPSTLTLNFQ